MRNSHFIGLSVLLFAPFALTASVPLFDFETPDEIAAVRKADGQRAMLNVESRFSSSGDRAVHWQAGQKQAGAVSWPSFTLTSPVVDYSPYDRFVVDVVNHGKGGEMLYVYLSNPKGRIQNGKHAGICLSRGYTQWVVGLKNWPERCDRRNVTRVHLFTELNDGEKRFDISFDRLTLLKPGEDLPVPNGSGIVRDLLPVLSTRIAELETETELKCQEARHCDDYWRLRSSCAALGQDASEMIVGKASPMVKVRPRGAFRAEAADKFELRLARYEKESLQVLVAPGDRDLANVRVQVGDLRQKDGTCFPLENVNVALTGYVNIKSHAPYAKGATLGWWPDPILEHLDRCDIRGHDVQSFWVRVSAPENQKAGVYAGTVRVCADGVKPVVIPLTVRINGFSVPKRSPLPMAITFSPKVGQSDSDPAWREESAALAHDKDFPINAWRRHRLEWGDFLADYYITLDSLYGRTQQNWDVLERLKKQNRLGWFNLGYWPSLGTGAAAEGAWRKSCFARLKENYDHAARLGILDHAYLYGCDEMPKEFHGEARRAVEILKRELPGVPVCTTAYDRELGVGTELSAVDWFTPLSDKYDPEKAARSRTEGRQVWWYVCCGPMQPYANMFIENDAIEARQLMGVQTVRMRPDGFLYYQISIWNSRRPIVGGPFTDWNPRSWTTYHGDGSWICVGPDGTPLATQRLENFRDGLEDYAYALELERRLKAHKSQDDAWARRVRELLAVPRDVMVDMKTYTHDPEVLLRWRNEIADLIEGEPVAAPTLNSTGTGPSGTRVSE